MNEFKLKARVVCQFITFHQWVMHATSWIFYDKKTESIICIDNEGYALETGADFMESRDKSRFPVTVHAVKLSKSTKSLTAERHKKKKNELQPNR